MINKELLDKYTKEIKKQNKEVAKVIKEIDNYFFGIIKMGLEYICTTMNNDDYNFSIEPCGDYYNNTYYLNLMPVNYLIVYHVKRATVENYLTNKMLQEKYNAKIYNKLIGNTNLPGFPTNEDIALRLYKFIDKFIDLNNKSFCKFGTIRYGLEDAYQVKIAVAYKYEDGTYIFTDNNKTITIDFTLVQENLKKKEKETKKSFNEVCALFKGFESELLCHQKIEDILFLKNYFVEELLYNVPSELFLEKDLAVKIDNIVKYLKFINVYKLKMLDDNLLKDKARIKFYKLFIKRLNLFNDIGTSLLLNIFN